MIPPLSSLDLRGVTDTLRRWMAGLDAWARSMGTASRLNADADVALAGNSDQVLPTQKAVKAYADAITAAVGAGYQPLDADLTAAAGLTTTGLVTRTGAGTMATRTLTGPAAGFTITDGNGVSGNPTFVLADDLAAVEGLSGTGMASRTAANTWALRQIAGTANEIGVTDGTGAAGNPTISLPTNITLTGKNITGGTFTGITDLAVADGGTGASSASGARTNLGLVIGTDVQAWDADLDIWATKTAPSGTVVGTTDSQTLTNKTFNASNNTLSNLTVSMFAANVVDTDAALTANSDTRLPSQAAVKSYVDNLITGLKWKTSAKVATTGNITLSGTQTIDGIAITVGNRVLVKDQTAGAENGIYICAAGAWSRAEDADSNAELIQATLFVQRGLVNSDTQWTCTNDITITFGTTVVVFAQVSGAGTYSAGTGLSLSGNQFSIADSELLALAGLTSAADRLPYFTGSGTAALTTLTSFGRSLIDDADASTARTTLGLGTAATHNTGTSGANVPLLNGNNTWSGTATFSASVDQSGAPFTITYGVAGAGLHLDAVAGTARFIEFETAGANRWLLGVTSTAESGSNAGSDFALACYTDAGSALFTALSIVRSTGVTTIRELGLTTDLDVTHGGTGASSASAARTNLGLAIGSDVQAYGALLDGLTALATTGHIVRTGAGTVAARTLTAPAAGISVSNGDGVSGNPTLALANDLAALEAMSGTGIVARTGSETYAQRTITGTANEISVANGDGVSGNPTVSLPSTIALAGKTITGLAASSVTNTAAGNIAATNVQTALNELDTEKVAKAGDTMTGALKLPVGSAAAPALVIGTGADEGLYLDASGQFRIGMGGAGYVTLSSGGNLGVGLADTVAPSNRIHAYDSGNSRIGTHSDTGAADFQATAASNDASGPSLVLRKDRGASTTPASVNTSDVAGNVTWQAYGGGAYRNAAQMRAVVLAASPSSTDMESEIEFRAPVSGSVTLSTLAKLGQTAGFTIGSGVVIDALRLHRLRSYTVATLPAAGTAGRLAYCSNEASGAMPVYDNGTNWIDIINGTTAA